MHKCKEIVFKNYQYTAKHTHTHACTHAHTTHTHTYIHTYIHKYNTYIRKKQNSFVKTKCKKKSIALKIEKDFQNRQTYYSYKKIAQILNIYIRIIAFIRKGIDVAAEMVTIKNILKVQKQFIRTSNWRPISGFKPITQLYR